MDFNITKASEKLSSLDLKYSIGGFDINVFWLRAMEVDSSWDISRHKHSSFEFHFVKSGISEVTLDNDNFIVKKGQFYITKPGLFHSQKNVKKNRYLEYCLNCSITLNSNSTIEENTVLEILKTSKCSAKNDKLSLISTFDKDLESVFYNKPGYYLEIKNSILMMIIHSSQIIGENIKVDYEVPHKEHENYKFTHIKRYINDNIDKNISVSELRDMVFLSPRQISRIVKKETGLSTKQYINHKRLIKAKMYLKNTDLTINDIANKMNFSSVYYFTQFFKREEGYSPTVFRSNILNV